jgi:hypothetical protein
MSVFQTTSPSGRTRAPSATRCGLSRPPGMMCCTDVWPPQCRHVGDQPPVTAPPHALTAHDRHRVPGDLVEHPVEGGNELGGSGVRGVGTKRRHGPPGVLLRHGGRETSTAAERLLPPVADPGLGEPPGHRSLRHVGVVAAAREATNIDQALDPRVGQQLTECTAVQRSMTDGQQSGHASRYPAHCSRRPTPGASAAREVPNQVCARCVRLPRWDNLALLGWSTRSPGRCSGGPFPWV